MQTPSEDPAPESPGARPQVWLVEVGCASAPLRAQRIHVLEEGRATELGRRDPEIPEVPGRIAVSDRWMSGYHAAIEHDERGWRLSDLGSSNGTLVWGRRRSTHLLADGDVFETGSTFWMFRARPHLGEVPRGPMGEGPLASLAPAVVDAHARLLKVARSRLPVVIRGPTGAGKEVLARAVHRASEREGPLVVLDVGTLPPGMAALELFGVESETAPRAGRLRAAHGGTMILDQLADMPTEVQVALLRVLQSGEVTPLGRDAPTRVDIRFVATTQGDIEEHVAAGRIRADLWSRLQGHVAELPALADRREDLGLLVSRFLERLGRLDVTFAPDAYRALLGYPWPHNVRELERTIEAAAALADGPRIELTDLPQTIQRHRPSVATDERSSEENRERELVRLLTAHKGNVSAVARSMGYSRMQVHRWMKQMNVDPNEFRGSRA